VTNAENSEESARGWGGGVKPVILVVSRRDRKLVQFLARELIYHPHLCGYHDYIKKKAKEKAKEVKGERDAERTKSNKYNYKTQEWEIPK
jgi:hypothetical protein